MIADSMQLKDRVRYSSSILIYHHKQSYYINIFSAVHISYQFIVPINFYNRWYTSMIGRKASMGLLLANLKQNQVLSFSSFLIYPCQRSSTSFIHSLTLSHSPHSFTLSDCQYQNNNILPGTYHQVGDCVVIRKRWL